MGLYSYIGNGEQVKCFYLPNIILDYNTHGQIENVRFLTIGGNLESYQAVPYSTFYYNYGKDFGILEFRLEENPHLHIIHDGVYKNTIRVDKLKDNQTVPYVIVDNHGHQIDIHSAGEIKQFVSEYEMVMQLWKETRTQMLLRNNLPLNLTMEDARNMSSQKLSYVLSETSRIQDEAYAQTLGVFNKRYYKKSDSDLFIIGLVLHDYLHNMKIKAEHGVCRKELEWKHIFSAVIDELKDKYENPLEAYFMWCDAEGIQIDQKWPKGLFDLYA